CIQRRYPSTQKAPPATGTIGRAVPKGVKANGKVIPVVPTPIISDRTAFDNSWENLQQSADCLAGPIKDPSRRPAAVLTDGKRLVAFEARVVVHSLIAAE